jgi:polyisoprenoid-binding protein YceI
MKTITSIFLGLLMSITMLNAQTWSIDPAHSNITFTVTHLAISEVDGKLKVYEGSLTTSEAGTMEGSKINFSADVASLDTDNEKRDGHLQSPDFFDAANNPKITFESSSFTKVDDKNYKLVGNLSMHGVTKEVALNAKYLGEMKDPWGNTKRGFKVTGMINRTDFGLKWNAGLEAGGVLVSEEVELAANVQLVQQ